MHFVATLKIEKIDRPEPPRQQPHDMKRQIEEVTQLTIKADTLEGLTRKLGAHIAIIEES